MKRIAWARESKWPHLLSDGYEATSVETPEYNCIAWAADVQDEWWWPDIYGTAHWPIPWREESIACFQAAYATLGYETCPDGELESGFEKIVIYTLNGSPTHAAKLLPDGRWKSKLGRWEDIEHNTIKAVEEYIYGKGRIFMKRHIPNV